MPRCFFCYITCQGNIMMNWIANEKKVCCSKCLLLDNNALWEARKATIKKQTGFTYVSTPSRARAAAREAKK